VIEMLACPKDATVEASTTNKANIRERMEGERTIRMALPLTRRHTTLNQSCLLSGRVGSGLTPALRYENQQLHFEWLLSVDLSALPSFRAADPDHLLRFFTFSLSACSGRGEWPTYSTHSDEDGLPSGCAISITPKSSYTELLNFITHFCSETISFGLMIRRAYLMVKEINVLPETVPRIPSIAAEADRYFRLNSTVLEATPKS
jgi:hypothetical protein